MYAHVRVTRRHREVQPGPMATWTQGQTTGMGYALLCRAVRSFDKRRYRHTRCYLRCLVVSVLWCLGFAANFRRHRGARPGLHRRKRQPRPGNEGLNVLSSSPAHDKAKFSAGFSCHSGSGHCAFFCPGVLFLTAAPGASCSTVVNNNLSGASLQCCVPVAPCL